VFYKIRILEATTPKHKSICLFYTWLYDIYDSGSSRGLGARDLNKFLARSNKNPFYQGFLTGIATINLREFFYMISMK